MKQREIHTNKRGKIEYISHFKETGRKAIFKALLQLPESVSLKIK